MRIKLTNHLPDYLANTYAIKYVHKLNMKRKSKGSPGGIVANVLDCKTVVSKFELKSRNSLSDKYPSDR